MVELLDHNLKKSSYESYKHAQGFEEQHKHTETRTKDIGNL